MKADTIFSAAIGLMFGGLLFVAAVGATHCTRPHLDNITNVVTVTVTNVVTETRSWPVYHQPIYAPTNLTPAVVDLSIRQIYFPTNNPILSPFFQAK